MNEGSKADAIEKIFSDAGAQLITSNDHGVKQFVYPIKKKTAGNYYSIEFKVEKDKLPEIEAELRGEKELIRYLIIIALRKPIELPPRIRPDKSDEELAKEDSEAKVAKIITEPIEVIEEVEKTPVQEKVAEVELEPASEVAEIKEAESKEEKVKTEEKAEKPKEEKKPARKPRQAKAEKVSAEELDKKLEELVKE